MLNNIELSQQLIQIPSYSGVNQEVIEFLKNYLEKLNFTCDIQEFSSQDSYPVNNLHAIYNPKNSATSLYFAGHTDVVNEGDLQRWTYQPFAGKIVDNKLFGRGASDMKCAIACFIDAVQNFLKTNPKPDFAIGFLITNDEENDGINGTKKMLQWLENKGQKITYCLVGEPTNPNKFGEMIKIGRRGSISFKLNIQGKQGHVAYPQKALNPITILINILKILKDHKFDNGNEFFDASNLEITHISSPNSGSNVIPNSAYCEFNIRFNNTHTSQAIAELVEYVCQKTVGLESKYQLTSRVSGEAFLNSPKKLAKIVSDAIKEVTNISPELSTSGGTSDARFIKDYATEVVEIGLVNETAHKIDEFANINEINELSQVYQKILEKI
ncbi:MAG: succinyl-diaminopimelate desuccinylase [Alphaproteobacteria bacterium]